MGVGLAVGVGLTWGTNAQGGHFVVPSVALDVVALAWAGRHRGERAWLVAVVALAGLVGVLLAALR